MKLGGYNGRLLPFSMRMIAAPTSRFDILYVFPGPLYV